MTYVGGVSSLRPPRCFCLHTRLCSLPRTRASFQPLFPFSPFLCALPLTDLLTDLIMGLSLFAVVQVEKEIEDHLGIIDHNGIGLMETAPFGCVLG